MIIKHPPVYDVSNWQGPIDWSQVTPRPALVFCKATEGNFYQDKTFYTNMSGLASQGIWRGVYHFYRKGNTAEGQANYFLNYVRGILKEGDFIALDLEEDSIIATGIIAWLDKVEAEYPHNQIFLYSSNRYLSTFSVTTTQADRLKRYPMWLAGYPYNPDGYDVIPNGYLPDLHKWGECWLWQYSDNGQVTGIGGDSVDLNLMSPILAAIVAAAQPPIGEPMYVKGTTKAADSAGGLKVRSSTLLTDDSNVIGYLPFGTPVEGYLENGWIRGTFKGLAGYISAGWVNYVAADPPPVTTAHTIDIVVDGVNVKHIDLT